MSFGWWLSSPALLVSGIATSPQHYAASASARTSSPSTVSSASSLAAMASMMRRSFAQAVNALLETRYQETRTVLAKDRLIIEAIASTVRVSW